MSTAGGRIVGAALAFALLVGCGGQGDRAVTDVRDVDPCRLIEPAEIADYIDNSQENRQDLGERRVCVWEAENTRQVELTVWEPPDELRRVIEQESVREVDVDGEQAYITLVAALSCGISVLTEHGTISLGVDGPDERDWCAMVEETSATVLERLGW